jgi:hypothetical protein
LLNNLKVMMVVRRVLYLPQPFPGDFCSFNSKRRCSLLAYLLVRWTIQKLQCNRHLLGNLSHQLLLRMDASRVLYNCHICWEHVGAAYPAVAFWCTMIPSANKKVLTIQHFKADNHRQRDGVLQMYAQKSISHDLFERRSSCLACFLPPGVESTNNV